MRSTTIFAAALSALSLASAQNQNFTIDSNKIDPTTRTQWCNAQFNTCGILCANNAKENTCTPVWDRDVLLLDMSLRGLQSNLSYDCACQNGSAPGLDYYTQTMPTFICEEAFSECIAKSVGDSIGQDKCKKDIKAKCGTLDPSKADVSSGSSSSSAAAPSGTAATTTGAAPASTSSHSAGAPTHAVHGVAVAAGILAAALL
ncbi:hypothetical protein QBC47DRAFT_214146 [Echria macrotheca]|uniref:DUF7707 domain-containing protein n=1 Tax=Echria macrotheca TaxID=438768 RepID=A0AAJ0BBM6_9PEZI|nr:hypothetical protein QBC47DRAFT_214146 [Echria macrotheca]